jgi:hypothetical protein
MITEVSFIENTLKGKGNIYIFKIFIQDLIITLYEWQQCVSTKW